jgi:hypothetical protein
MGREGFAALLFRIGGKQPASDFDASSLGITFADQATLSVALDLAELIAIDRGVKGGARLLAAGPRFWASSSARAGILATERARAPAAANHKNRLRVSGYIVDLLPSTGPRQS